MDNVCDMYLVSVVCLVCWYMETGFCRMDDVAVIKKEPFEWLFLFWLPVVMKAVGEVPCAVNQVCVNDFVSSLV